MINGNEFIRIGYKSGPIIGEILKLIKKHYKHTPNRDILKIFQDVLDNYEKYLSDPILGDIAKLLAPVIIEKSSIEFDLLKEEDAVSLTIYGEDNIEPQTIEQMKLAARLPVAVKTALMPDGHLGYGLSIGGVLATKNAIIPYAVGVDIGCRMCLTLYDMDITILDGQKDKLKQVLESQTRFGTGSEFEIGNRNDAQILESNLFNELEILKSLKDKAWAQLGSSGSGNHFVEFGIVHKDDKQYIAILSHSGSRGIGAKIADYYTKIAKQQCILPDKAKNLAWLDLNSEAGQEYWLAMNLAGDYAQACHHTIHKRIAKALGWTSIEMIENHHNFAWKEIYNGEELIVHRKGATPAGQNVLGIIPSTMVHQGYIVKGKGNLKSLNSASHGSGRLMSRTKAKSNFTMSQMKALLKKKDVILIGGSLDESPMAYKDGRIVMGYQSELVDIIGTFTPKIVRMAEESGEY